MPDATICVNVSHTIVATPIVVGVAPLFVHGDTDERPRPKPRMMRMYERAAAAAAPANTAPQLTADPLRSLSVATIAALGATGVCMVPPPSSEGVSVVGTAERPLNGSVAGGAVDSWN